MNFNRNKAFSLVAVLAIVAGLVSVSAWLRRVRSPFGWRGRAANFSPEESKSDAESELSTDLVHALFELSLYFNRLDKDQVDFVISLCAGDHPATMSLSPRERIAHASVFIGRTLAGQDLASSNQDNTEEE